MALDLNALLNARMKVGTVLPKASSDKPRTPPVKQQKYDIELAFVNANFKHVLRQGRDEETTEWFVRDVVNMVSKAILAIIKIKSTYRQAAASTNIKHMTATPNTVKFGVIFGTERLVMEFSIIFESRKQYIGVYMGQSKLYAERFTPASRDTVTYDSNIYDGMADEAPDLAQDGTL